jgi:predicted GNAT family N-acyltransferase
MEIRIANESDKKSIMALRYEVFVNEQNVPPEIEVDEYDADALHFIAESDGVAIGCARVVLSKNDAHIGRLAVSKSYRGNGIGSGICRFILDYCLSNGYKNIWLNSQLHAVRFYEGLGFRKQGVMFYEAGIPHFKMSYLV